MIYFTLVIQDKWGQRRGRKLK